MTQTQPTPPEPTTFCLGCFTFHDDDTMDLTPRGLVCRECSAYVSAPEAAHD